MKRIRSSSVQQADARLLPLIRAIKASNPFWGYRRVWAYLRYRMGHPCNAKRVYRLMREQRLLVPKDRTLRACRTPMPSKMRSTTPNTLWGMDMTKVLIAASGWLYLHVVTDWASKKIVGAHVSHRSKTEDWLQALNQALNAQFPKGIKEPGLQRLKLLTDNGCQPTSVRFIQECAGLGIEHILTSYSNPKGNADTERMIRTIKESIVWPFQWESARQFQDAFHDWIEAYNHDYPHSAIHYKTPIQYEQSYNLNLKTQYPQKTLLIAA